jgi:CTP-dependent riboflavin kinase
MEESKLKEVFHFLFNKANNIFTAVGSTKLILEEDLDKLSSDDLKKRIAELFEVINMTEKNISILNKSLQEIYDTLKKEINISNSGTVSSQT